MKPYFVKIVPVYDKEFDITVLKPCLCSRDIQVGDICFIEGGSDSKYTATKDGLQGYFKVIGQISSGSLWVREGDEFEENEWKEEIGFFETVRIKIKIKCPKCNHFH